MGGLVRWLGTLYENGALGGLSDARLVERFAGREGTDREDAFSVLVYRHGPMVQRVCRRMLVDPADADDAFQAVFLILARKAGSLRRPESLQSWLYGVAVRTSLEARKRSAQLKAREGAPLEDSFAVVPRDDSSDQRALLDEELNKLPNRFREPLLLCELEGLSRRDAARRLGLPEGTLSSRLARGRSLLRDRLTRRGVTAGALGALLPPPAKAAKADASLRLALKFANQSAGAETVSAPVVSLAEGVTQMIHAAKLKSVLLASTTLVAACLAAGLVAGWASPPVETPQKVVAQAAKPAENDKPSEPLIARGVIVDEAGGPVAGAEVRVDAHELNERSALTDQHGAFAVPVRDENLGVRVLIASADGGGKLGVFRNIFSLTQTKAEEPTKIVVRPSREIAVKVVDSNQAPIEGAAVEAVDYYYVAAHETTGADGVARLRVPPNINISMVVAQKGGAGLDYAEFGEFDEGSTLLRGVPVASLPDSLTLTLESAPAVQIKAVDPDGEPMAGVEFKASSIRRDGRRSNALQSSRLRVATTDADGIATFDWLPPMSEDSNFVAVPVDERFTQAPAGGVKVGRTDPAVFTLVPKVAISGRVVMPDGSPARDVAVVADGAGTGRGAARSGADGTYRLLVPPHDAYAVYTGNPDWVSTTRLDVLVFPDEPADGVDFQLSKPTIIKGTLTAGDDDRHPAVGKYVRLSQSGLLAPEAPGRKKGGFPNQVFRTLEAPVDAEGRYQFRVGPGTYKLAGPPRAKPAMITVTDQAEIVHDLHIRDAPQIPVAGRVIVASDGKPAAGARVDIISWGNEIPPFTVTTDAEGRFQAERAYDSTLFCAWSSDGSLGDLAEIRVTDEDDAEEGSEIVLKLKPTASATGLLLDDKHEPAANRELEFGRLTILLDEHRGLMLPIAFAKVATDDQGRFTLPALVVGVNYNISARLDGHLVSVGSVKPDQPGPMDLGTLRIDPLRGR